MKIIMMGTGGYALPTFRALYETDHVIAALFTRPEIAKRSRQRLPPNPMRELAAQQGTPVFDPEDVNASTAQQVLRTLSSDLLIVCDYGQILAAETLGLARYGGFNLHASLLPKYRGAAPINWALYHGETQTGNTVIHMTPQIDGGPCVAQETIAIDPDETAVDLEVRLASRGARLVSTAIGQLAAGTLVEIPQDKQLVTRAPKLKKSDGVIDWTRSAQQIHNQVRAMQPWPKTFTNWLRPEEEPLRLILSDVRVAGQATDDPPGSVVVAEGDQLVVATGDGLLVIRQLQPSGKRVMAAKDFLRGYHVRPGDTFAAAEAS
ncbi:MAG: methionyl-tRNA formyltransferase [Planctomycetota bacterium]|nr:methionyl-tRNA formyltransferase [Planctomycetota bacterium]